MIAKIKNIFGKKVKTEKGKSKMIYAFTGVSGFKYYRFEDTMNEINFERYHSQFALRLVELQNRISNTDLSKFIEKTREFTSINQYRSAMEALDIRRQITMDTNMMYELMAVLYLREDEENEPITNDFLAEKAKDIRETAIKSKDSSVFFCEPMLSQFLNCHGLSQLNLSMLQSNLELQTKTLDKIMKEIRAKIQ